MELHATLIVLYYLFSILVGHSIAAARGYANIGGPSAILSGIWYIIMTAAIFATGDPSSWQAVFLMLWWALNTLYGMSQPAKVVEFGWGAWFLAALITIPFLLIGANIPPG